MIKENMTCLDNGLKVVTKSMDNFESVVMGYWVNAGAVCENERNNGISHFLEHMAFKGTTTRTARQIAEAIESVGGYSNAYTSRETTAYHTMLLKDDKNIGIDILSDIMQNPTFLDEELERERGVILQEISQTNDTPDNIIFDHFQRVAFPDQSMGRPILGPTEIVSKITADDLRAYRDQYYNADNMIFCAAGNVCHEEILDYANKYFSKFNRKTTQVHDKEYSYKGGVYSDVRDLEQSHVIIGFNGVSNLSTDYYTMAIFSSVLGGGMSSRLFQEVREKRGLVYSVYAFTSSFKRNGLFGIYAATSKDKLEELSNVAIAELIKMRENITEEEFKRTKTQFKANLLMSQEMTYAVCEQTANQTIIFGEPQKRENILAKINAVTIDDIMKLTDKIISSNVSIVTVGQGNTDMIAPAIEKAGLHIG